MNVPQLIEQHQGTGFSFEVLPPLKGKGIAQLFKNIDCLKEFNPLYINITTHRSEMVYKSTPDGLFQKVTERSRPGTVAVAAAIQQRYDIPAVPHIICSGYSKTETEYALIDLNFLGITNLLLLRGDKAKHSPEAEEQAAADFADLYANRDENFGNARDVRNLFEQAVARQSNRVAGLDAPTREQLMELTKEDLKEPDSKT